MVLFCCSACGEDVTVSDLENLAREYMSKASGLEEELRLLNQRGQALSDASRLLVNELGLLANV